MALERVIDACVRGVLTSCLGKGPNHAFASSPNGLEDELAVTIPEAHPYVAPRSTALWLPGAAYQLGLKAKLDDTRFAWYGPTTNGSAAYYRIQGPTLLIEYAPQQGSTSHIHTIIRDPSNDYAAELTKG